jgi:hypothetical protein
MIFPQEIMEYVGISLIDRIQPKGIKPNMGGRKLRSGVYWQAALKQEGVKQAGLKTRTACIFNFVLLCMITEECEA